VRPSETNTAAPGARLTWLPVEEDTDVSPSIATFAVRDSPRVYDAAIREMNFKAHFPGVYLRMDGNGVTQSTANGGGVVNCQYTPPGGVGEVHDCLGLRAVPPAELAGDRASFAIVKHTARA
jgi:hypothetical protein